MCGHRVCGGSLRWDWDWDWDWVFVQILDFLVGWLVVRRWGLWDICRWGRLWMGGLGRVVVVCLRWRFGWFMGLGGSFIWWLFGLSRDDIAVRWEDQSSSIQWVGNH